MSTSEKLTYLNVTKQKLKQAINNIGGEVTDETTFREYVNQLDGVYDVLPKTSFQEGTSVTLENCNKGKLDYENGVVGIGQSSQETTQGYNELNIYAVHPAGYTETVSGVKITYNDDGSVTANGLATADINYFLGSKASLGDIFNGTYYLSGCTGGSGSTYGLSMWVDSTGVYLQTTTEVATSKTSGKNWNIVIMIKNGTTINKTFYPMMCATSGKTFEKYTGGYASPSPNWEQQVKCVAGKNLAKEKNGNNVVISDILPTGTYTFSLDNALTNGGCNLKANNNSGTTLATIYLSSEGRKSATLTLSEPTAIYLNGYSNISGKTFVDNTDNFQLEEGIQATPYLPYNTIEEVVRGKNIYSGNVELGAINGANGQNESNSSVIRSTTYANVEKIRKIAIVGSDNVSRVKVLATYDKDYHYLGNSTISNNNVFDLDTITISNQTSYYTSNSDIYYVRFVVTGTTDTTINYGIIDNSTTYEPYHTPVSYQLSLGDHKFYGIGTYRDYILRTTGKNLYNAEITPEPYYYSGTGEKYDETTPGIFYINQEYNNIDFKQITISRATKVGGAYVRVCEYNGTTFIGRTIVDTNQTITLNSNTNRVIFSVDTSTERHFTNLMIEQGSTASDYQPFGVGNWYKVGKIGNIVLDGSNDENWQMDYNTGFVSNRFICENLPSLDVTSQTNFDYGYCNIGKITSEAYYSTYLNVVKLRYINNKNRVDCMFDIESLNAFKTLLAQTPMEIYYQRLGGATYTPITGTLAEQLEAWYNAQSINGTTIIESNGDLPLIIKVRALKGE